MWIGFIGSGIHNPTNDSTSDLTNDSMNERTNEWIACLNEYQANSQSVSQLVEHTPSTEPASSKRQAASSDALNKPSMLVEREPTSVFRYSDGIISARNIVAPAPTVCPVPVPAPVNIGKYG